jgi:DNA polymerase-3 subunit epsilon
VRARLRDDRHRHETDKIIELALQRVYVSAEGRIVMTGKPRSWLEDPGVPISPEITRITGLTDEDVKGQLIAEGEARCIISSADVVLSHNAGFDRPFVEKRLGPAGSGVGMQPQRHRLERGGLRGAIAQPAALAVRWFYEAHRARAT